jgi:hypothetical protein
MNKDIKKLASEYVKYKLNWVKVDENTWEAESCYWGDNGEPIMYRIKKNPKNSFNRLHINRSDSILIGNKVYYNSLRELQTEMQNDNYENVIAILLEQLTSK